MTQVDHAVGIAGFLGRYLAGLASSMSDCMEPTAHVYGVRPLIPGPPTVLECGKCVGF